MAIIKQLKDISSGEVINPMTVGSAVTLDSNESVQDAIDRIDESIAEGGGSSGSTTTSQVYVIPYAVYAIAAAGGNENLTEEEFYAAFGDKEYFDGLYEYMYKGGLVGTKYMEISMKGSYVITPIAQLVEVAEGDGAELGYDGVIKLTTINVIDNNMNLALMAMIDASDGSFLQGFIIAS